ncbi:radical SAM protein [bacterium]|nr:radical SAM protein [bacterium]
MKLYYLLLKLNSIIKIPALKQLYVLFAHLLKKRHLTLFMDPILSCNLKCKMCHFSEKGIEKKLFGKFKDQEMTRLSKMLFKRAIKLQIGCAAEPTLYKNFLNILIDAKKYKVPFVSFISNGQLLTQEHIQNFIDYELDELILSMHGVSKNVYENFMTNSSHSRFLSLLRKITDLRKKNNSSFPKVRINYTVNPDNLHDLSKFFDIFGLFTIDILQIRIIKDLGNTAYKNFNIKDYYPDYIRITDNIAKECKERNITHLIAKIDREASDQKYNENTLFESIYRNITPQTVWKNDFNWREENYDDYCKRIHWSKILFKNIFVKKKEDNSFDSYYDINV